MKTHLLPLAVGALILGAPVALIGQEVVLDQRGAAAARRILDRSDRVVVAGFRVVFRLGIHPDPGRAAGDAAKDAAEFPAGVTADDFQRITDEAYADFTGQLGRSGVAVLEVDALKGGPGYGEMVSGPLPGNAALSPGARVLVFNPRERPSSIGRRAAEPASWRTLNELSVETKAVVLLPTLVVDITRAASDGRPCISLAPQATRVAVIHARVRLAGDVGYFQLGEEVVAPGAFGASHLAANSADYPQLALDAIRTFNRAAGDFIAAR